MTEEKKENIEDVAKKTPTKKGIFLTLFNGCLEELNVFGKKAFLVDIFTFLELIHVDIFTHFLGVVF